MHVGSLTTLYVGLTHEKDDVSYLTTIFSLQTVIQSHACRQHYLDMHVLRCNEYEAFALGVAIDDSFKYLFRRV